MTMEDGLGSAGVFGLTEAKAAIFASSSNLTSSKSLSICRRCCHFDILFLPCRGVDGVVGRLFAAAPEA